MDTHILQNIDTLNMAKRILCIWSLIYMINDHVETTFFITAAEEQKPTAEVKGIWK